MNITVVCPPIEDFYFTPHRGAPLGASIVCELIREAGHHPRLLYLPGTGKPRNVPISPSLEYLKDLIIPDENGPLSFFTRRKRYGPGVEQSAQRIADTSPDIIMVSCFAYAYADHALKLIKSAREMLPDCPVLVGGAGASVFPGFFLQPGGAHGVIRGEAETSLPGFFSLLGDRRDPDSVRRCVEELPNGTVQPDQDIAHEPPLPADASQIRPACLQSTRSKRFVLFSASLSRGCPMHCSFCSCELTHGRGFRLPDLEDSFRTISSCIRAYPLRGRYASLNIEDDNLLADPPYLLALVSRLSKAFPGIRFTAENGIDYRLLTPEIVQKMIHMGFYSWNLSAGIIPQDLSYRNRRSQSLDHLEQLCNLISYHGVPAVVYAIIGAPGDSRELSLSSLRFLRSLPARPGISPFYALPGLKQFQDGSRFMFDSPDRCCGSSLYPWSGALNSRELVTLFRLSRLIQLEKAPYRSQEEQHLLDTVIDQKKLHTWIRGQSGPIPLSNDHADGQLVELFLDGGC